MYERFSNWAFLSEYATLSTKNQLKWAPDENMSQLSDFPPIWRVCYIQDGVRDKCIPLFYQLPFCNVWNIVPWWWEVSWKGKPKRLNLPPLHSLRINLRNLNSNSAHYYDKKKESKWDIYRIIFTLMQIQNQLYIFFLRTQGLGLQLLTFYLDYSETFCGFWLSFSLLTLWKPTLQNVRTHSNYYWCRSHVTKPSQIF